MKAGEAPHTYRLAALRSELASLGLSGFIVPRSDEQLGEYVPASSERLKWLTGFSGSAGLAVVLTGKAGIFCDGRYSIQASVETNRELFEQYHILQTPPAEWTVRNAGKDVVGYDPRLMSQVALQPFVDAGVNLRPVPTSPIDAVWDDRPEISAAPIVPHPLEYSGQPSSEKRIAIGRALREAGHDHAVIVDSTSIAWLLNVRGNDIRFVPGIVGSAIVDQDGHVTLFVRLESLSPDVTAWLGNSVTVRPPSALEQALKGLSGKSVRVDPAGTPLWFEHKLRDGGARLAHGQDPCSLPKACKNSVERNGLRNAHLRDGLAMVRFLSHMADAGPSGSETEMSAAARLLGYRAEFPEFRGESFQAISSAGEHAALNHYKVTLSSDRRIAPDELYLVDSGGQYLDGTTDVTRTIWTGKGAPPDHIRDQYTRVLKGHISLETLVFPHGTAGVHIDAFARRALWEVGLDYDHGTGHGVGCYLGVHEGPASISKPLRADPLVAGMLMANEPGYYVPGRYGIRLENLMFVADADIKGANGPFLTFETITLVPFERSMIDMALLSAAEVNWINSYHRRVHATLSPDLTGRQLEWLCAKCAPL